MHLVWLALCMPAMGFLVWSFPGLRQTAIWSTVFFVTAAVLVAWLGFDIWRATSDGETYNLNRVMFVLLTMVDFPLLALIAGSFFNWGATRWMVGRFNEPVGNVAVNERPDQ